MSKSNWIVDFFVKLAKPSEEKDTTVTINIEKIDVKDEGTVSIKPKIKIKKSDEVEEQEKEAELELKFGDLVNMKLDPENKAIFLEDQDSKPGDIDLLLYFLKPQIDGHQVIETPHVEVQPDPNRKATPEEISAAKTAFNKYKQDMADYKKQFNKKKASEEIQDDMPDQAMSEKERLEMTVQLLKEEIQKEKDPERLKSLQNDLDHSNLHLQQMSSLNKDASNGDIGFDSHNDAWYRIWVKESDLKYDNKVESIVKSDASDSEKRKLITERAKEIAQKQLSKLEELASENSIGVQFYHLWVGDLYMDRLNWDELLHADELEAESSLKKDSLFKDWWKKYKNSKDLKSAYEQYKKEVKAADIPVPEFKDWAKEQYNELAGFTEKAAATDPETQTKLDDARSSLLESISTGYNIEDLTLLFNDISKEFGLLPESIMDMYDELYHNNRIVEENGKSIVKGASLNKKSYIEMAVNDKGLLQLPGMKQIMLPVDVLNKFISDNWGSEYIVSSKNTFETLSVGPEELYEFLITNKININNYVDPSYDYDITNEDELEEYFQWLTDNPLEMESALNRISTIVKRKDGYYVISEKSGRNLGGPYGSKAAARRRLRQIEYFKHKSELLDTFELINRTAKSKEEAETLRKESLENAVDLQEYPLDKEIKELVQIIDQISEMYAADKDLQSQITQQELDELKMMAPIFKDYLNPSEKYISQRLVLEYLDRSNEILDI